MTQKNDPGWAKFDNAHIWHPYSKINSSIEAYLVESANGVKIKLASGHELIDGMSSWWSTIHGYNQPEINRALQEQMNKVAHIMFGGLTHQPAVELASKLIHITPEGLDIVFFSDSGSVSIEVAMKMAIQYWHACNFPNKQHFITIKHGYHGDTFGAMSICDPINGMHSLFKDSLIQQFFADAPISKFGSPCCTEDLNSLREILKFNQDKIGALVIEPIVQGAGGMRFYSSDYLREVKQLCIDYDILLIADEIATGFGRTGKLFACEHAGITPDIMCVGKALTGGYLSLAATLTTTEIAQTISKEEPGIFMHGPTFMANPMACTAANASIDLLLKSPWETRIESISNGLKNGLEDCKHYEYVEDVRVLGAIGVVELTRCIDLLSIQPRLVELGVWVRPFGKLIYLMPAYIINENDLGLLTSAIKEVVSCLRINETSDMLEIHI